MRNFNKIIVKKADKLSKEQLLAFLDEAIEENESLYSILESLSTGILILDSDFVLQRNNTVAESRIPFTNHLDDIKNSNEPVWNYIEDEEISSFLERTLSKGLTNCSEEFSIVTQGGSVRYLTITISPLVHKNQLSGSILLIRDITEVKNQEVLLHRMENMANLTNLAAGMAHEIKNPLGAMSIHTQLIQKALKKARDNENILPPKKFVEDHIDIVNEEIEHLNKLVMDFLLAVRPVKATLELKDPEKIIENIVNFFLPEFKGYGTNIQFTPSGKSYKIMLDEKLFRDVFINLSQNALAAIRTQFPECENFPKNQKVYPGLLTIQCSNHDNKVYIKVSDNGCGMTDETIGKIFEPYYTTKANGTGLGMTMVYKIVKEFAGEIQVSSKVGEGSSFTLSFPIPQKDTKLLTSKNQ